MLLLGNYLYTIKPLFMPHLLFRKKLASRAIITKQHNQMLKNIDKDSQTNVISNLASPAYYAQIFTYYIRVCF